MQSRPPLPPRGSQSQEDYQPPSGPPPGYYQRQQKQQQQQQQQNQQQQNFRQNPTSPPGISPRQAGAPPGFPSAPEEPAPPPSPWNEHLFYSNGRPTPVFQALMTEFFKKLDPRGTGYITPEAFSSFLDVNHFAADENVWKRSLTGNLMWTKEDMADYELKACFEAFYFEHKVAVRNPQANRVPHGGMPMLSLAGFIDIMSVEIAGEADSRLGGLNNALRHYGVWTERGPVPRYVLPSVMAPEIKRRVEESSLRSHATAQTRIDSARAQAEMEAKGRRAALSLISPRYDPYGYDSGLI